jgi:hypothetical protein
MTIGIVDAGFPAGANMDGFDVGLLPYGVNSAAGLDRLSGDHGNNPLADGHLSFHPVPAGDTQVIFDADGSAGSGAPVLVTTLDHLSASLLKPGVDWVFG